MFFSLIQADNLKVLKRIKSDSIHLVYIDPPFNTGRKQQGKRGAYNDRHDSYIPDLMERVEETKRILRSDGSFLIHLDCREVHYVKVELDKVFGRDCFMNEIIWSYDYGGRSKKKWPSKHDNILWYVRNPNEYTFNFEAIDRIPYEAPSLCGPEKAARGKTPTDVWKQTIVHTTGKERTGYPTQKPLKIIERIVKVHSNPGDIVLDFYSGSGTTGFAAVKNERSFILVDNNQDAIDVTTERINFVSLSSELPNEILTTEE